MHKSLSLNLRPFWVGLPYNASDSPCWDDPPAGKVAINCLDKMAPLHEIIFVVLNLSNTFSHTTLLLSFFCLIKTRFQSSIIEFRGNSPVKMT